MLASGGRRPGPGHESTAAVGQAIGFLQKALQAAYRPGYGPLSVPDALAAIPA